MSLDEQIDYIEEKIDSVRLAKKQYQDKLFDETFNKILEANSSSDSLTEEEYKKFQNDVDKLIKYVSTEEFKKQNDSKLDHVLLDPNDNPTYIVESIQPLLQGDMEGAINGEYWNSYNQDDPIWMHPKCVGDTSSFKGFKDMPEWQRLDAIEKDLLEKLSLLKSMED